MNSPNLMAAAAAQRTKKLKLLIYGDLLPLHEPLRLAEELAMLDCLSNGRLISGFARGIPREYQVHNVPLKDSRWPFASGASRAAALHAEMGLHLRLSECRASAVGPGCVKTPSML
jgi:alkanesulfonate monooxygenase SsuD/methylene tetrahydromethanopterin reductase-like flavin-dependent oxidoreductase (luciferase family)